MDLAFVIYLALGFVALGIWLYAEWSWIRVLSTANGTRPFVTATVNVAHLMTLMSAIFAFSPIWEALRPEDGLEFIVRAIHRVLAIAACVAMLRLHHTIEEIVEHKVVSEE